MEAPYRLCVIGTQPCRIELRTPHSALRTPNSELRTPNSGYRPFLAGLRALLGAGRRLAPALESDALAFEAGNKPAYPRKAAGAELLPSDESAVPPRDETSLRRETASVKWPAPPPSATYMPTSG